MRETEDGKKIFSLVEVTASIRKTLTGRYSSSFWVAAEMNKLNHYPHSGHCYPDLVEKAEGKTVAQLKSTLWREDYIRINRQFLKIVKSPLKDGIRILFCARVTFDPVHGLALRIIDIDPVFSLGELEREKQESILRLQNEGIFDRNKRLVFPMLPQRLAVISVETSKGYADFQKVIQGNSWNYKFFHLLFPAVLQGDRAVPSIRYQLSRIRKVIEHFDAVAIIRGGGGDVGLSCFNDYTLARDIALFPLPVITGIGHATNETVAEMVAWRNAITPTELGDFLLQRFHDFARPVERAEEVIAETSAQLLEGARESLSYTVRYLASVTRHAVAGSHHALSQKVSQLSRQTELVFLRVQRAQSSLQARLVAGSSLCCNAARADIHSVSRMMRKDVAMNLRGQKAVIDALARTVNNLDPLNVLKRGYTLTRLGSQTITSANDLRAGDVIETRFADGTVTSKVENPKL